MFKNHFRKRRWMSLLLVLLLSGLVSSVLILRAGQSVNSEFGLTLDSVPVRYGVENNALIDRNLLLADIPQGFHVVEERRWLQVRSIPAVYQVFYQRNSGEKFQITLYQGTSSSSTSAAWQTELTNSLKSRSKQSISINGHEGYLLEAMNTKSGLSNECTFANPFALAGGTSTLLLWRVSPVSFFLMASNGLSKSSSLGIASGLSYTPRLTSCTGSSPNCRGYSEVPVSAVPPTPSSGDELLSGHLNGLNFMVWASIVQGQGWYQFDFRGKAVVFCSGLKNGLVPTGAFLRTPNGTKVLVGALPEFVTSVSAIGEKGDSVSVPVLSKTISGAAVFVLSLGRSGHCADLCSKPISLEFKVGNSVREKIVVPPTTQRIFGKMFGNLRAAS